MENILKYSIFAIIGLFAVALIVQLIYGLAYPGYYGYGGMMGGYGGMMGGYGMGFGMLGGAIFLIILIVVVIALLEQTGTKAREKAGDALELLNKRYASGEITREEYLEKKKDLE